MFRLPARSNRKSGAPNYGQRRAPLESLLLCDAAFGGDATRSVPINAVCPAPNLRAEAHADAQAFSRWLREADRVLSCDFIEGVVMKRANTS